MSIVNKRWFKSDLAIDYCNNNSVTSSCVTSRDIKKYKDIIFTFFIVLELIFSYHSSIDTFKEKYYANHIPKVNDSLPVKIDNRKSSEGQAWWVDRPKHQRESDVKEDKLIEGGSFLFEGN